MFSTALLGARAAGTFHRLELEAYDHLLRVTRGEADPDHRITLIRIHERDIQNFGHPLTDELLARGLEALASHGPRAIGVDLYRDRAVPPGAQALERVVLSNPAIVMTERLGDRDDDPVMAPSYLAGTGQVGFSDVLLDPDGRARRGLLMGAGATALSTQLVLRYLAFEEKGPRWVDSDGEAHSVPTLYLAEAPLRRFHSNDGSYVGADDAGYQILLDYRRGRPRFASYSFGELLAGAFDPEAIRDRVVILGTTASSVHDRYATPFGEAFGLEHHAEVVSELLDRANGRSHGFRFLPDSGEIALVLLCGVAGALLATRVRSPGRLAASALGGLAGIAAGALAAFFSDWWLPVVPASLAWMGSGAVTVAYVSFVERGERRRVMDLFGRFLEPKVADEVWRQRDAFLHGGRPRPRAATITVMMTDLAGYTAVSESLEPERLMEWINGYLEAMAKLVGRHGGVVDDYAGDGIKANFGVPLPRSSEAEIDADAVAAVECALAMEAEVEALNRHAVSRSLPPVRVRIGLHTGPAILGVIGGSDHLKFTSVGDTVNTAARLESYQPDGWAAEPSTVRILVGEATFRRLGGAYLADPLGKVELKGKAEPVSAFRIRGRFDPEGRKP